MGHYNPRARTRANAFVTKMGCGFCRSAFETQRIIEFASVRVLMVVMGAGIFNGNQAAMRGFADHVLELQGRVVDPESFAEHAVDAVENHVARRRWDVGNGDVAGERVAVGAEAPDVEVVDILDAFNGGKRGADFDQ